MDGTLVRDVMVGDVAYVTIPGYRDEVLKVLKERWVSGVPVLKGGKVVGMVTRTDLLRNPEEDQIAMLMTRNPYTVRPDQTLVEAARLLADHDIRRLPVVEDSRLVGIITVADVIRAISEMDLDMPIDRHFQRGVVVVWDEMPLPVAGAVMEYAAVQASPVINSQLQLVGMVSDRDLIAKSIIEETVERADMNSGPEMDEWSWESKETMSRFYQVSRITLRNILVSEAMVKAITAIKSSKVSECAMIMRRNKIDQLPVVSSHQKLIGLLTDRNLIQAMIMSS
ncbi:MAG: Inosine-5'-monophosphate dehydrogenase [Methanosaeta sp. PtaB.Bin039]|nr:MAG: Inosine-5'-monophosphate dehydrogenase [Methanosaeta sp. PtaB.Bin039]OPY47164.1 MAG: Inosine-5'-monophosphate dehydrogenase [Methanosaeta sp. PtaU1.Bin028]HOT06848.1 CBS domain-containing protein [Methanotrichaceae archaeon]HQF16744.1 CBS domain-containing protein [Methanotrichaceae archaeon]HQI91376.1 CBS domain-containing protein [Methanotrichaceae archaeon]